MPLSEEELRLLKQMERALVEEDPRLASTLRGTSLRSSARRRALFAGISFLGGITVLMAGVITELWLLGVVGFLIMLASATISLSALRGQHAVAAAPDPRMAEHPAGGFTVIDGGRGARRPRPRTSSSFLERMEARWRRRRDEGGGF